MKKFSRYTVKLPFWVSVKLKEKAPWFPPLIFVLCHKVNTGRSSNSVNPVQYLTQLTQQKEKIGFIVRLESWFPPPSPDLNIFTLTTRAT